MTCRCFAYERRARSRVLTFRLDTRDGTAVLRDAETGSTWDVASGTAVSGAMEGAQLPRATAYPAFWFGWRGYFPATAVWQRASARRDSLDDRDRADLKVRLYATVSAEAGGLTRAAARRPSPL